MMKNDSSRDHIAGRAGILCVGWLLVVVTSVVCGETSGEGDRRRHIAYRFLLRNTTNRVVKQVEFRTYAPVERTSIQQRTALTASHPFELLTDPAGNQILRFTFSKLPPYASKQITIEADLLLSDSPQPGSNERTSGVQSRLCTIPGSATTMLHSSARYLQPEPYCESDDPEILRLAMQLQTGEPGNTAERIFRWVVANIHDSGYLKQPRGARYALRHRHGDCTEFMYLFIALCRAAGIPARGVGGYVVTANTILDPAAYHNWAEFYHDGVWHLADPQRKVLMKNQSHYLVMRLIQADAAHPTESFRRFRATGEGLEVTMN